MKKTVLTCLQVGFTLLILWWLLRDPQKRAEMAHALQHARPSWLLAGFAAYGLVEILSGIRWQILLRLQGIQLSSPRVLMLLMIGVFFNFLIPGGTGGDVVKTFYLLKETPGKGPQALLSVLFDRLVGLFSLISMAGILAAFRWDWLTTDPDALGYVWIALGILGASLFGIAVSFIVTGCGLLNRIPEHFPGRDKLAELGLAYNLYGRAWLGTGSAILLSFAINLGYCGTFYCAARSLAAPDQPAASFVDFATVMPLVNSITSMPISFGGVGVREKLFEIFLGNLVGISDAVAVVISSTGYLLTLAWGILGGVLYLFYRPSEHAKLRQMTAQVAAFEHQVALAEESKLP